MKKILLIIENDLFFYPTFLDNILKNKSYNYFVLIVETKSSRGRVSRLRQGLTVLPLFQIFKGVILIGIAQLRRVLQLRNSSLREVVIRRKIPFDIVSGKLKERHHELFVNKYHPDLIVSASGLILPDWVLKSCNLVLNMHFSKLPQYAGIMPIFHSVINNERFSGVTLHEVTLKIDSGKIFNFLPIEIDYKKTLFKNYQIFFDLSVDFLHDTIKRIFKNEITPYPQSGISSYHRWPNLDEWRKFKKSGMAFF